MKYKDTEGHAEELIRKKLEEIEAKEQVRILHAVESGSRAWGFASIDSDYDVRFVYVRPVKYYLALNPRKDFINWELDEMLDINGWDLSKALQHFHKSNAVMYEWSNSPIVYRTTPEWDRIREVSNHYFSRKAALYHYYGTANKNYLEHLTEDMVKYKKYFYVLRPLLACKWIEENACPPPVLFRELTKAVLEETMKPAVESLVQQKMEMTEKQKGKRLDGINEYIVRNLVSFKQKIDAMEDDRNGAWEELNQLFLDCLTQKVF